MSKISRDLPVSLLEPGADEGTSECDAMTHLDKGTDNENEGA